jgi:Flp pilus assembly protein TadD
MRDDCLSISEPFVQRKWAMSGKSFRLRNPGLIVIGAAVTLLTILLQFGAGKAAAFEQQICDIEADSALGLENYSAAIALHLKLLRLHPNDALAHYHLGFAYGMIGHDSQEIDEYRKAVQLGLRDWDLYLDLGLAYLEHRDHSDAIKALQRSATLGPRHPEVHFNLAIAYETAGRLGDALREIVAALRLAPADLDTRNTKAIICAELGDLTCAHDEWNLLRQIAPDYAPPRTNLEILMGSAPKIASSSPNTIEIPQLVAESWSTIGR